MAAPWSRGAIGRIIGKLQGQDCINVFTFATNTVVNDPPAMDTLLLQIAEALLECALQTLLPGVTSDYTLIACDARLIYPTPGDPVIATANAGSVGELASTNVSFAASLMNIRTGVGGRSGRGRKFLPPPGDGNITNSAIDPGTIQQLTEFALCLAGKFIGANKTTDWDLGVLSRKIAGANNAAFDQGFRIATQLSPVQQVAMLGSRKVGRGA